MKFHGSFYVKMKFYKKMFKRKNQLKHHSNITSIFFGAIAEIISLCFVQIIQEKVLIFVKIKYYKIRAVHLGCDCFIQTSI